MFEWLERELSEVKTPRFHVVDGRADLKLQAAVIHSHLQLPPSYRQFVLKFGNAKLYRCARNDSYLIGVLAGPIEETASDGTRRYRIGFHDGATVYLKRAGESLKFNILESESGPPQRRGSDFEKWLKTCCVRARRAYGKKAWVEIVRGPEPFTMEEQEIVEARRQIHWRDIGIDPTGNHMFEVTNGSGRTVPVLTVGVRSLDGRLNGAIRLKIGNLSPGKTAVLHEDCYKDLVPPHGIELFSLPDPRPEDRERYWEFGGQQ